MEKEFIKETERSVTLNVTAGRIDSFRELEKNSGTVRIYDNGCIGVAGCLGAPDENDLTAKAKESLSFGIPYPCKLEGPLDMEKLREDEIIAVPDLIPKMQSFLDRLGELCPRFAFTNKIGLRYNRSEYENSAGRHLVNSGRSVFVELVAQNRGSGNLFDTFFEWSGDHFDEEVLLRSFKQQYDAFYSPADITPGRYPVISSSMGMVGGFFQQFIGDLYAAGASLLSGKLGERVFSEKFTFRNDMNPSTSHNTCFFDAEGCTAADFRPKLVENGILKGLLTTKKTAELYGLPNLGTADASYDGVPEIGFDRVYVEPTANSIKDLVPGKAVYVIVASGGDTTPEGHFATPVQMSYLMEDGVITGRLPSLSISNGFFDMFGRDYIGTVHDDPLEGDTLTACFMDVDKT